MSVSVFFLQQLIEEEPPVSFEEHPLTWKKFEEENITVLRQLTPPELERL